MKLIKPQRKFTTYASGIVLIVAMALVLSGISQAGTLLCAVAGSCADITVLKMQATSNSHAGLATSTYTNFICCSGPGDLGTNCSGTYGVVARLSGDTNAHIEYGTSSTAGYDSLACLSAGSSVSIGYQAGNCNGYDTTIASMSSTTLGTNAHIGSPAAYSNKICGSAASAAVISVSITSGIINYGIIPLSASSSTMPTSTQSISNNGDAAESFNIKGQNTACPWTLSGSIGPDTYKFEHSTTSGATWANITTGYTPLIVNVAKDGGVLTNFRITMPSSSSCAGSQSADLMVQAISYP